MGAVILCVCMLHVAWAQKDMQAVTTPVKIFQKGYIQVIGGSEEGQSRYRASRAAEIVAQRDLLEILQGLRLSGTSSVKDGMLQSDEINTSVQGFLRGAIKCGEKYHSDKGYAEVCMRLNIRGQGGLYDIILPLLKDNKLVPNNKPAFKPPTAKLIPEEVNFQSPRQKTEKKSSEAAEQKMKVEAPSKLTEPYDGLIVDTRNFQFRPALVNRIMTEKEQVVFEPSNIQSNVLVERGCGGFTTNDNKAKALLESWGSKNPMIVKCVGVEKNTDAKISQDDAAAVYVNNQKSNLLAQARVVFVLK
ncbi:MAG TPA: hypothetical protein ENJ30_02280 [Desulfobulbaceae bacterium]|nr:hypothetical protein [Desulfobulbaceae bacterium]